MRDILQRGRERRGIATEEGWGLSETDSETKRGGRERDRDRQTDRQTDR